MSSELRLILFGKPQFTLAGETLTYSLSEKAVALLTYLAFTGQPHSYKDLADLLWGEMPENAARESLDEVLLELGRCAASYLNMTEQTVAFDSQSGFWSDALAFNRAVNVTLKQMDDVVTDSLVVKLEQVVELYRGDFLQGFRIYDAPAFEKWVIEQRKGLHQLVLQALQRLVDYYIEHATYAKAIDAATQLLAIEPWLETAHRSLMIALALGGQRGAALAQYEICRRMLAETMGAEPNSATNELYERIIAGRLDVLSSQDTILSGVVEDLENHNLPLQITPFVGRKSELSYLIERLRDPVHRLITLVGGGGIGKTRLAQAAAERVLDDYPNGIWFVPLNSVRNDGQLLPDVQHRRDALTVAVANALNLTFSGSFSPEVQLHDYLRNKSLLLILDNFEHLVGRADFVMNLLQSAPNITILVTSREPLNLQAESVIKIKGLPVPTSSDDPGALNYSSVRLFAERAGCASSEFTVTPQNLPYIVEICQLVEGFPLGIELAAAWADMMTCEDIVRSIQHGRPITEPLHKDGPRDFLATTKQDVPQRHQSLRTVFENSWNLLSADQQKTLAEISVFESGFTHEALLAVTSASLTVLYALINKSLVQVVQPRRYAMHRLMRQFAAEKLAEMAAQRRTDTKALHDRYSVYYLAFVAEREMALNAEASRQAAREIFNEVENIQHAWYWAVINLKMGVLHHSVDGLACFFQRVGFYAEGLSAFRIASQRLQTLVKINPNSARGMQVLLSRLLTQQAHLLNAQTKSDEAIAAALEAIGIAYAYQANRSEASGYLAWGQALWSRGEYEVARFRLEQALILSQKAGAAQIEADVLRNLGVVAMYSGDYVKALGYYERSLALHRDIEDLHGESATLNRLGDVAMMQGNYQGAFAHFEQALMLYRALVDRKGQAQALANLGRVASARGEYAEARIFFEQALEIGQDIGNRRGEIEVLTHLGRLSIALGDIPNARIYLSRSLHLCHEVRARQEKVVALGAFSLLLHHLGQDLAARDYSRRALRMAEEIGDRSQQGYALTYLGHALFELGDLAEAAEAYRNAVTLRFTLGESHLAIESMSGLAHLSQHVGCFAEAESYVEKILGHLTRMSVDGLEEPFQVYLICVRVLQTNQPTRAHELLTYAYHLLLARAARIDDANLRTAFLEKIPAHRELISEYETWEPVEQGSQAGQRTS